MAKKAKTERVVLSQNESAIQNELKTLNELKDKLNTIKTLYRKFTDGECEKVSMEGLNEWLKLKTNFDNPELTSKLLNKHSEYYELAELFELAASNQTDRLTKRGNTWQLEQKTKQEIEDRYTTYLSDRLQPDYHKLLQIVEIIETMEFKQGFNAIQMRMGISTPQIDLVALQRDYFLRGR